VSVAGRKLGEADAGKNNIASRANSGLQKSPRGGMARTRPSTAPREAGRMPSCGRQT